VSVFKVGFRFFGRFLKVGFGFELNCIQAVKPVQFN